MMSMYPEYAAWAGTIKTNALLADIFDMLNIINANLTAIGSGKAAKRPKPYPRPNAKHDNERHFGSGALPVDQLHKWIEERRAAYARNSSGHNNRHSGDGGRSTDDH